MGYVPDTLFLRYSEILACRERTVCTIYTLPLISLVILYMSIRSIIRPPNGYPVCPIAHQQQAIVLAEDDIRIQHQRARIGQRDRRRTRVDEAQDRA